MAIVPWFWSVIRRSSNGLCHVRLRKVVRIEGAIPTGAVVVCAKHGTGLDIPILADFCGRHLGRRPHFQMGSFIGYPVLGLMVPFMKCLGGFPVMRPKEVLRLKHRKGWDRERVVRRMNEVNDAAERMRESVLRSGGALVVFPEGTRDADRLRPLTSETEVATAVRVAAGGVPVRIWPVMFAYGPRRFFRRPLLVTALPPFEISGNDPGAVLARVEAAFRSAWKPPQAGDAPAPAAPDAAPGTGRSADIPARAAASGTESGS